MNRTEFESMKAHEKALYLALRERPGALALLLQRCLYVGITVDRLASFAVRKYEVDKEFAYAVIVEHLLN